MPASSGTLSNHERDEQPSARGRRPLRDRQPTLERPTRPPSNRSNLGRARILTRLHFVRHGQSVANAGGVTMEHAEIPLSPLGERQASRLARILQISPSRVLTSKFLRARETAVPFCEKAGCEAEIHPLLHEFETLDPDTIRGMTGEQRRPIADAYWQRGDLYERAGPRAETFDEFDDRVTNFMGSMESLPDGCVVFGHGMWIGLMLWKLAGFGVVDSRDMKAFRRFQLGLPMPNCAVYNLESVGAHRWLWQFDDQIARELREAEAHAAARVVRGAP